MSYTWYPIFYVVPKASLTKAFSKAFENIFFIGGKKNLDSNLRNLKSLMKDFLKKCEREFHWSRKLMLKGFYQEEIRYFAHNLFHYRCFKENRFLCYGGTEWYKQELHLKTKFTILSTEFMEKSPSTYQHLDRGEENDSTIRTATIW